MKGFVKKGFAFALAGVMGISLLAGCGAGKEENGVTTVTVWTNSTHTKDLMTQLVADFNEGAGKEQGIKIDYVVQGGDYQKVLDVSTQAGELPDLYYPISGIENLVKQKALTALEDMPGGAEFIAKYQDKLVDRRNILDGKTYTVPYNLTTIGLIYNKDMFKKKGLVDENGEAKAPTTWEEVREYAKICTDLNAKEYGIALPLKWGGYVNWDLLQPFFSATGTMGWDPVNTTYNYDKMLPALEWFAQIKADESYYIGAEGLDNDPARAQFAEGNIAMKLGASWDCGVLNDQFPAKCDWGVAPIPGLGGAPLYKQFCSTDPFLAIASGIPEEKQEKVMTVYKWFHEADVLTALYKGGKIIPADDAIIESVTLDAPQKGWAEFCAFATNSLALPVSPKIALEGDTIGDIVMDVWMGEANPAEDLKDLNERSAQALQKEIDNGKVVLDDYKLDSMDAYHVVAE